MIDSIYKIFRATEWQAFQIEQVFHGSVHDIRDGFIHLCAAQQLAGTLEKHFTNIDTLTLARFHTDQCENVRWEVSRDDEKFPHIYGGLALTALRSHMTLIADPHGAFQIPTHFLGGS